MYVVEKEESVAAEEDMMTNLLVNLYPPEVNREHGDQPPGQPIPAGGNKGHGDQPPGQPKPAGGTKGHGDQPPGQPIPARGRLRTW